MKLKKLLLLARAHWRLCLDRCPACNSASPGTEACAICWAWHPTTDEPLLTPLRKECWLYAYRLHLSTMSPPKSYEHTP
jgi:hypothetical protein